MESKWIWRAGAAQVHEFLWFRREFQVEAGGDAIFRIAAPDQFVAYLDGEEVLRGQFSDYPDVKTFSEVDLHLEPGRHEWTVLAYFCGQDFGDCAPGVPAMRAEFKMPGLEFGTGVDWQWRPAPEFVRDRFDCNQYGFAIGYDARKAELPPVWQAAEEVAGYEPKFVPRPTPSLELAPPVAGRLIRQGYFTRPETDGSYAVCVAADRCFEMPPFRVLAGVRERRYAAAAPEAPWVLSEQRADCDGIYLLFDLGGEFAGLEEFDWEFPAGTLVDVAYGEHIVDGRVRCRIGNRNFGDRYIAGTGRRRWTVIRRVGCRYLELHIIPAGMGRCAIYAAGLRPWQVELPDPADYFSSDLEMLALRRNSIRTLEVCMHEHYEDCPWREQALYAYDSRNQMVYGACIWGNFDFASASLKLLGRGLRPDGLLNLCAPTSGRGAPAIPMFTLIYLVELAEYYRWSGRGDVFAEVEGNVKVITDKIIERFDAATGLYLPPFGKDVWHFYEWRDGTNGVGGRCDSEGREALYNLYCIEAMDALGWMLDDPIWRDRADALRQAVHRAFFDPETACYRTRPGEAATHEITQLLALYNRCVPAEWEERVRAGIVAGRHIPVSLSSMRYYMETMLPHDPDGVEKRLRATFLPMTRGDSTTMWETERGEADFSDAGSLCHGWSALPIYFQTAGKLGIMPEEPGFRTFSIAPLALTEKSLEGEVPTPFGPIRVRLGRTEEGCEADVTGPSLCKPVFKPRAGTDFTVCRWNGELLP